MTWPSSIMMNSKIANTWSFYDVFCSMETLSNMPDFCILLKTVEERAYRDGSQHEAKRFKNVIKCEIRRLLAPYADTYLGKISASEVWEFYKQLWSSNSRTKLTSKISTTSSAETMVIPDSPFTYCFQSTHLSSVRSRTWKRHLVSPIYCCLPFY